MTSYQYSKSEGLNGHTKVRIFALFLTAIGIYITAYVFSPLLSWQIYFAPVLAARDITAPIPKTTILDTNTLKSLVSEVSNSVSGVDYSNAKNWFSTSTQLNGAKKFRVESYFITIPKVDLKEAIVSTTDYDLSRHLVHYGGTSLPGEFGNAVVFGHSTLPQLFNEKDYKTIFAKIYKLGVGDDIFANVGGVSYRFKIFSIIVVDPTDSSVFSQNNTNSFLTLVTCTPPGTTWKRLIIKSKLVPPDKV